MKQLRRNMRVVKELIRLRFQNLMMFRLGFFGPFFVDGSLFCIQILVFQAVYANVERIGSWEKGEMMLYIGTFSLLNAVNMMIYFFGVNAIPYKIKSGDMDLYLTKPISPLLRLSLEQVNPGSVPLIIMSILIITYGVQTAGIRISPGKLVWYLFWLVIMQVLYYEMEVIIRAISFYITSATSFVQLEEAALGLCMQLPGIAFYGIYKVIFYVILPYGIMATIPVQSIAGEMTAKTAVFGIGIVCIFSAITYLIWINGKKHYNSASS
ncbi:MAG: ABC transporter permease [Lachnospiraceae bacterium]|nr:ABC transporter permease [Lachnospiraceae bacterium]